MTGIISRILYNQLKVIIENYRAYKESLKEPCQNDGVCGSLYEMYLCPRCENVKLHRDRLLVSLAEAEKEFTKYK